MLQVKITHFVINVGKIWNMSNNLYNGNCLEVMKELPDNFIDFILTDPPYGTTACKWDFVIPYEPMWAELKRIRKNNTAIALFGTEPFSSHLRLTNLDEYKYDWIWIKERPSNPALAKKRPLNYFEKIHIFYKKNKYYPQFTEKRLEKNKRNNFNEKFATETVTVLGNSYKKTGLNNYLYPKNYQNFYVERGLHPTQKPVTLLEYLIRTYTKENEVVLDFTMGSGSTGVACVNTNRDFIGIELNQKYYKIAQERIGQKVIE